MPVFGAGAYNPKEKVIANSQTITLAQYASRMNIKLLRPADFNSKLREHGADEKAAVQKICRVCRDEKCRGDRRETKQFLGDAYCMF